jgi:hypothetical protein
LGATAVGQANESQNDATSQIWDTLPWNDVA